MVINADSSPAAEIRKKQKLKRLLAVIGESLKDYFIEKIAEKNGERPKTVSIKDVVTKEKGTSKSKVHYITYYLSSDVGEATVHMVVKFSSSEERYKREIENYERFKDIHLRYKGVYTPKIIYTSPSTRAIIYEGIKGASFRECKLDQNYKHHLAGQVLAAIHGINKEKIDITPYKKFLLYLLSMIKDEKWEKELLELFLPHFLSLESAYSSTIIHGDFHQGNLIFEANVPDTNSINAIMKAPRVRVYVIDTEFSLPGRDRCEDIGTFYAKPILKEFHDYGTISETKKDIKVFIEGYNSALKELNADFTLKDLYPKGETLRFHMAIYILYTITEIINKENLTLLNEKIVQRLKLIRKLLNSEDLF